MKIAQDIDVDGVTIIINTDKKLQAVGGGSSNNNLLFELEEESYKIGIALELPAGSGTQYNSGDGVRAKRIKGTNYFVISVDEVAKKYPNATPWNNVSNS